MTFDERIQAVARKGFTERQARFLTTVMLHAGVCVPRQYARFCGIVHGAKTRKFFAKLVRLGYASMYDCRHNRARIYHVNQRALYATIGEPDSTFRRRMSVNRAIQRLMVLDAIVEDPDLVWLATAEEKAANLTALTAIAPSDLPHVTVGDGDARKVRYFPERLPIGIHLSGRGVIAYVFSTSDLDDFRVPRAPRGAAARPVGMDASLCRPAAVSRHRRARQEGRRATADDAAQARCRRRDAVVLRSGPLVVTERRRALQSLPKSLLVGAQSGALQAVEAGR
jgi:hypothetical protein